MDPNGTRYHLLLGSDDWTPAAGLPGTLEYDAAAGREELLLRTHGFVFQTPPGDRAPALSDRRGAAADAHGNLYWIDDARAAVRVQSAGTGGSSLFWEPGRHAQPAPPAAGRGAFVPAHVPAPTAVAQRCVLAGLTVTDEHYLVVGTNHPAGLLVFDLLSSGPPRQLLWPPDVAFEPWDFCPRDGGGAYLLDRAHRLWAIDRHALVVPRGSRPAALAAADFTPVDDATSPPAPPVPACPPHREPQLDDGLDLGGDPIAIARSPRGVLVVDRDEATGVSAVRLLAPEATQTGPAVQLRDGASPLAVLAHAAAFAAAGDAHDAGVFGTLFVAGATGNQAFAFTLRESGGVLSATLEPAYYPMRLYGGKGLVRAPAGVMYDIGDTWLALTDQARPQHDAEATLELDRFDSHTPGTVWHRLLLDACIPPGTAVTVMSRAADEPDDLVLLDYQPEPGFSYRRGDGSERPFAPAPPPGRETYELLLQRARGRYLQLRLELAGDGRRTPRLHALRAYFPRVSYLDAYLPAAYAADPESASFLERYLANVEGIQSTIEARIAAAQILADPRTTPAEALAWLLGWFDVTADPTWDEARQRLFLAHAADFFAIRGTVAGIKLALRLALDPRDGERLFSLDPADDCTSRIVERFRTKTVPPVALGDPTAGADTGPTVVAALGPWTPGDGGEALRARWRAYVGDEEAEFPLAGNDRDWQAFVREVLRIDPPASLDAAVWRRFLAARYGPIAELHRAWGLAGSQRFASFDAIPVPTTLPPDGPPLRDWFEFVGVVLPGRRAAHRFTVLLPVPPSGSPRSPDEHRAIAERVVELQKPAHTRFDVKFFWAAFRVGEARLGEDTLIDLGSRDPRLRPQIVIGTDHVGEGTLAGRGAPVVGRVGCDSLNSMTTPEQETP
jgi:phage tail-like protein